jgi:pilus assembly protein Flp/PilA
MSRSSILSCASRARDEAGATAVEYAIMVAGIALAIIYTVSLIGPKLAAIFASVDASL